MLLLLLLPLVDISASVLCAQCIDCLRPQNKSRETFVGRRFVDICHFWHLDEIRAVRLFARTCWMTEGTSRDLRSASATDRESSFEDRIASFDLDIGKQA
jgi:hypothetical protein